MKIFLTLKLSLLFVFLTVFLCSCQNNGSDLANANRVAETPPPPAVSDANSADGAADAYCEMVYTQFLEENQQDYVSCLSGVKAGRNCPKPDGFEEGVKEALNIVIALDSSGSMNGRISGRSKIRKRQLPAADNIPTRETLRN